MELVPSTEESVPLPLLLLTRRPLPLHALPPLSLLRSVDGADADDPAAALPPVRVAFLMRDNFRHRRAIEQAYVRAINRARERVDIACPYFYPGRTFRRALRRAALRGVSVRLLLQGKLDYRLAGLAAQVLYAELLHAGVQLYEYTPAYLHAKVAVVDGDWATVGSSNIDPLSLLLNLEANAIVHDARFTADLAQQLEAALQASAPVLEPAGGSAWWGLLRRGFVAWTAYWFLRLAGMSGRY
jgi:cardiolipin synthase